MSGVEIAAIVGAVASLIGAGASAASAGSSNNRAELERNDILRREQGQARNNQQYIKMLNALALQDAREAQRRSGAGTVDAQGNQVIYDPQRNQWVTIPSQRTREGTTAAQNAGLQRNTIDQVIARIANQMALKRSMNADLATGPALAQIENYRPVTGSSLSSLLMQRAATANADAYRPLIQDTLRSFARTGTAAGPVLGEIGSRSAADLRKAIIDATIAGETSAADINARNRSSQLGTYTTLNANANPTLQFPGIVGDTSSNTLADVLNQRAGQTYPVYKPDTYGTNLAESIAQTAGGRAAESTPYSNRTSALLSGLGGSAKDLGGSVSDLIKALSGRKTTATSTGSPFASQDIGFGAGSLWPE